MATIVCPTDCACHTGPYAPCSTPGGCGSEGCGRTDVRGGCILCPIYWPDAPPRLPDRPPVCEGDRRRIDRDLADIADLHGRLQNPDPPPVDNRRYTKPDRAGTPHEYRADPLAAVNGAGPIPGRTPQPSVSGSRDRTTPAQLDVVDLTAAARPAAVHIRYGVDRKTNKDWAPLGGDPDQIGHLSAATILDHWVSDWRAAFWPEQHLPVPTVADLVAWLRAGHTPDGPGPRVDTACDQHPAIDEFAADIRRLRNALRAALGETPPRPELVHGVACRSCDTRAVLRLPGDTYEAECGTCGLLYTRAELTDWTGRLGQYERSQRSPEDVRALLRRGPGYTPRREAVTSGP